MMKIDNLHVYYDHVHALKGISLHIPQGKIVALLGANGAGKSTTLKAISGLVKPKLGTIEYQGESITKYRPSDIVKKRIIHCVEDRGIFPNFTVEENLKIGSYTRKDKKEIEKQLHDIYEYFPRLKERKEQKGNTLSGGEAQMLAIARSLMARPALLLLDEPSLGVAPIIVKEIFEIIKHINNEGVSILLVEQNVNLALQVAHYGYVLENGNLAIEGETKSLKNNTQVQQLYLGETV
jgi:branched-chain amino acid transport system ATP-binding protein